MDTGSIALSGEAREGISNLFARFGGDPVDTAALIADIEGGISRYRAMEATAQDLPAPGDYHNALDELQKTLNKLAEQLNTAHRFTLNTVRDYYFLRTQKLPWMLTDTDAAFKEMKQLAWACDALLKDPEMQPATRSRAKYTTELHLIDFLIQDFQKHGVSMKVSRSQGSRLPGVLSIVVRELGIGADDNKRNKEKNIDGYDWAIAVAETMIDRHKNITG